MVTLNQPEPIHVDLGFVKLDPISTMVVLKL